MRQLESRCGEAFTIVDALEACLRSDERVFVHFDRTSRRRLRIDSAGSKQLAVQRGEFGGYVRFDRSGRELYLNAPALSADGADRLIEAGRAVVSFGSPRSSTTDQALYEGSWRNRDGQVELEKVASDPTPLMAALAEGAGPDFTVRSLTVSEVLREQVCADGTGPRGHSLCRGVSVAAVVSADENGEAACLDRYAADLDRIDAVALGHELALTAAAFGPATGTFTGHSIGFLPSAAAQLLRALTTTILSHPISTPEPLITAVVDDGRAVDGCFARAFDCEGTPTSAMDLVTRHGEQQAVATRVGTVEGTARRAPRAPTGHAVWEAHRFQPQPGASNVRLTPGGMAPDFRNGESCLVVDVRNLGVAELRAGGQLAFRLLAVRVVDGRPAGAYAPVVIEGEAADFLAALTAVGETASYSDGPFAVGGAPLTMDLARLSRGTRPGSERRPSSSSGQGRG
ncbi:metallopeptidase TldD-related protein [Catenulispora pinisilvae]|uniref:metallopeptidase TldD-related protein n=1 Tax=Catenulispora pinisilvae TaxID=2705253 RepID=UPI001891EA29|nr:metallopeptidase TldD-related protein [Catenulispora pinisilvae]